MSSSTTMDFIHYNPAREADLETEASAPLPAPPVKQFAEYPLRKESTGNEPTVSPSTKSPSIVLDFIHYVPPDADGKPGTPIRESALVEASKLAKSDDSLSTEEPEETEGSTRPRLTKEQVNVLEDHFLESPKPTTATKKQLALDTGLTIARVGNWFQNRRAKAKQQKKWEDLERKYSMELQLSGRRAQDPAMEQHPSADAMPVSPERAKLNITLRDQANLSIEMPPRPEYPNPSEAAFASLERCRAAALMQAPGVVAAGLSEFSSPVVELPQLQMGVFDSNLGESYLQASFPPSAFSEWGGSSRGTSVAWTPAIAHADPFDTEMAEQAQVLHSMPEGMIVPPTQFVEEPQSSSYTNSFVIPALPSRLREMQSAHGKDLGDRPAGPTSNPSTEDVPQTIIASAVPTSSPSPSQTSMSLAARRKRPRPAAIGNAALRSHSFMGTFPASPTHPTLLGPPSPMRRIKSAGNTLNPRNRIHKAGSITPGQRSPLLYSSFKEAAEGIMAQIARPPTSSSSGSSGLNACYAPPTPLSPPEAELYSPDLLHGGRLPSSPHHTLIYNPDYPGSYVPALRQFGTPPTTPFDREPLSSDDSTLHSAHFYAAPSSPWALSPMGYGSSSGFGYGDDALISPMFQSFPDVIHMPQPMYVSPLSSAQPAESELVTAPAFVAERKAELYESPQPMSELSPQMQAQLSQGSLEEKISPQIQQVQQLQHEQSPHQPQLQPETQQLEQQLQQQHHELQMQLQHQQMQMQMQLQEEQHHQQLQMQEQHHQQMQEQHHQQQMQEQHHQQLQQQFLQQQQEQQFFQQEPMLPEADASTFGMHPLMHMQQGTMF